MTGLCNVVLLACVLPAGSLLGAAPPAAVRVASPLSAKLRSASPPLMRNAVGARRKHHSNGPARSLKKKAAGSATAPPQVKTSNFLRKARPGRQLGLTPQRQLERYREMSKDDSAQTFKVYARVREAGGEWSEVGLISASSRTTLPAAVQAQKRLILGHAGRAYPALAAQQSLLECGAADADAAADAAEAVAAAPPAPAKECGFAATADDGSGHYFGETTRIAGEGKKVILNGMKDDHKSKVAEQFSKSLGLRSG